MPNYVSTHTSLLARLRDSGDEAAWYEFHERYVDLIRGFARRRGLQAVDADDVAQEVLMAVHRGLKNFQYDPEKGTFRGFLKTITLRTIWKRNGGEPIDEATISRLTADSDLEAEWEAEWRQYHLRLALARVRNEFTESEFRVFEALTADGRGAAQVAEDTGIAVAQVYRIKSNILRRIRELVAGQVAEEG